MIKEVKVFKVKILKGKWSYKDMVGSVIEVVNRIQTRPGRTIPIYFQGKEVYAFEKDGRNYYIDPADTELANNNQQQSKEK